MIELREGYAESSLQATEEMDFTSSPDGFGSGNDDRLQA
jgi:hypothetical protein